MATTYYDVRAVDAVSRRLIIESLALGLWSTISERPSGALLVTTDSEYCFDCVPTDCAPATVLP
jgi:hypothetical protein